MTSRNYLLTINNPEDESKDYLERFFTIVEARYLVGQLEVGDSGTRHFQIFLNFKNSVRCSKIKKIVKEAHIEVAKQPEAALTYCKKEQSRIDGPWEFGTFPFKMNSKKDWEAIYEHAKQGQLEKIPKDVLVKHYGNIQKIQKDNLKIADVKDQTRGIWIYGPTGSGKSTQAREIAKGDFYPKMANKWWDGYQGQKTIILDDLDDKHECLGHHLKIWADHYGFIGESKGGAVSPDYDTFIVTSNYHPDQIFKKSDLDAILRRFKLIYKD